MKRIVCVALLAVLVVKEIEEADMLGLYQQLGMELKPKAPAGKR